MKGRLLTKFEIQHILDAIYEVESYLEQVSLEEFLINSEKGFVIYSSFYIVHLKSATYINFFSCTIRCN